MNNPYNTEVMKETIKELYRAMNEIARLNHPDVYLMPVSLYNEICKKIAYLDRALKNARESNERLKIKLKSLSKSSKDSKNG